WRRDRDLRRSPCGDVFWHGWGAASWHPDSGAGVCGENLSRLLGRPPAGWGPRAAGVKTVNVILTGLRGTGKSSVGKVLAQRLQFAFVDTDTRIEELAGCRIAAIVAQHGWEHFRALERQVVTQVAATDRHVVAAGGGTLIDVENARL